VASEDFVDCVRTSLPYAWELISSVVDDLDRSGTEFADNQVPPPSWGLCAGASDDANSGYEAGGADGGQYGRVAAGEGEQHRWPAPRRAGGNAARRVRFSTLAGRVRLHFDGSTEVWVYS